VKKYRGTLTP